MTCNNCDLALEAKALQNVSNEMLFAEIKVRRESARQQRAKFYKIHFSWGRLVFRCILVLLVFCLLYQIAVRFNFQVPFDSIWVAIAAFSIVPLCILFLLKDAHVSYKFRKEFPVEAKFLFFAE